MMSVEMESTGLLGEHRRAAVGNFRTPQPASAQRLARQHARKQFLMTAFALMMAAIVGVVILALARGSGEGGSSSQSQTFASATGSKSSSHAQLATLTSGDALLVPGSQKHMAGELFGPDGWELKKMTHVCKSGEVNATFAFMKRYLMQEVEPASNLGCGATRIKLSASFPFNHTLKGGALQFVEAPAFNDAEVGRQESVDW